MPTRILVMGLPGAGKTTFAQHLKNILEQNFHTVEWFNADSVRQQFNDWDFSEAGRMRQSQRMRQLADASSHDYVICDFVAPLPEMRHIFKADYTIWIDSITQGRYDDTNKAFVEPELFDFRIPEQDCEKWVAFVLPFILENRRRPVFDWQHETVQMLGRWQPWHGGHRALFERAVAKTGQVIIQVRNCQGWKGSNPFGFEQVARFIRRDLDPLYQGMYEIMRVPNITNITYGRSVGYKIEQEIFDEDIHAISATSIRKGMGLT